ncbi:TfuA-like protein [Streptomyces europaeiscabiei]|uniref:TfuA-like protein n=1 Tax=Streptomyces europaeiscabiei TaxID=146819 RepID=UPI0029BE7353|nr:TfuA-like protein [Streptomyces europaeiscabiei]MDX2758374.1 TfuA-like protein [Streptomyces europaeiscabiei]
MIHLFIGPTLPRSEPLLTAPEVRPRPPVRHGDLFPESVPDGDTVVIIDGVYHQAPALRHKEIIAAMGRGVRVIGAASIGALRAAELAPHGMLGVGSIYTAYVRGEIEGDDEVAVGQAPDGEEDGLTWPVVNLWNVLKMAAAAGVLSIERAAALLEALREVYYPQRTAAAVRAVCRRHGEGEFARWLEEHRAHDQHFGDLKRADALAALRTALRGVAPKPNAGVPPMWRTPHFLRWSNAFARTRIDGLYLSTEDRLIYQQVFCPQFNTTWTAYLEHRSLLDEHGPGLPLATRLGYVTGGGLAAHQVFHPALDLREEETVALLLAEETPEDRQAVARYAKALDRARRSVPGFSTTAVCDGLTGQVLRQVWRCPAEQFDAEASARGLVCGARAIEAAKRLMPGFMDEQTEAAP